MDVVDTVSTPLPLFLPPLHKVFYTVDGLWDWFVILFIVAVHLLWE